MIRIRINGRMATRPPGACCAARDGSSQRPCNIVCSVLYSGRCEFARSILARTSSFVSVPPRDNPGNFLQRNRSSYLRVICSIPCPMPRPIRTHCFRDEPEGQNGTQEDSQNG